MGWNYYFILMLANNMAIINYCISSMMFQFGCFLTSASDIFTSLSFWTELFSFTFRPSFLPSSFLRIWRYNIQNENISPHILQSKHLFLTNNHKIFMSRQRVYLSRSFQFFTKFVRTKIINIQLQRIIYFLR